MIRPIRNVLLILGGLAALFLSALMVLGTLYEDEVKARLLSELNTHLNGPVDVESMDLTLIRRFPNASLHLEGVLAREALPEVVFPDTLLHAEDLYLEFGLIDLFKGNYIVRQIHGEGVTLRAVRDSSGTPNWSLWRSDTTSGATQDLELARVSLDDLDLSFLDLANGVAVTTHHDKLLLRGRFTDDLNDLSLEGDLSLDTWTQDGEVMLADREARIDLNLAFGGPNGAFEIKDGHIMTGQVPIDITLNVVERGDRDELDLRANGMGLDLGDVIAILPVKLQQALANYGIDGEADVALHYSGPLDGPGPTLSVGMQVRNGRIQEQHSGMTFKQVNGDISFDLPASGRLERLVVKGLKARSGSGTVQGDLTLLGTTNAPLDMRLRSDIALDDLLRFAGIDTLEHASGRMATDLTVQGELRDASAVRVADLGRLDIRGTVEFMDAKLKLKGVRHAVSGLNAALRIEGNDAAVTGLQADLQGNRLQLEGDLRGLVPYLLFEDQRLSIVARGRSPRIDLATLLQDDGDEGSDYTLTFPDMLDLDLEVEVDELVMEDFKGTDIRGRVRLRDKVLTASHMTMNTASGAVLASLSLDTRGGTSYPLEIDASVQDINVSELFAEFQEFGQSFITSSHLHGVAKATVSFRSPLDPSLQLNMDHLSCVIDLTIDNGRLKSHTPLIDVAEHLKKNQLVSPFVDTDQLARELADVSFSRLENRIEIRNRQVIIPAMTVHNNVMDINMSGTHAFDDRIDHHMDFRLTDLFRKGQAEDEFGPVVDDGTGMRIFLHMYGTVQDPQFANDGAMAAARRKAQMQEEKQELRSILKNELGIFSKKDSTSTTEDPDQQDPGTTFTVDWEDGDSLATATPEPERKRKRGLFRIFEEGNEAPDETIQVIE